MPTSAPRSPSAPAAPSCSDQVLIGLAARGDHLAFERLFRRHRDDLHAYALRMLRDHASAEDVVQDVFVSAIRALDGGQRPRHVRAWLHEVARCACIDHWRGNERRREVSYDAPDGLSHKDEGRMAISGDTALRSAADRESLVLLRSAFGDLPPLQHTVLVQREFEGRSPNEIADRLGVSRTVVEGQLARGRRQLAVAYRELQSGERCLVTRGMCDRWTERPLGVRDRARVRRHLRGCDGCRRYARDVGVDRNLIDLNRLSHLGLLLPLPLLRRFSLGPLGWAPETTSGLGAGKALIGAAVLAAGGGGAVVASDVAPSRHGSAVAPRVVAATPAAGGGSDRATGRIADEAFLASAGAGPPAAVHVRVRRSAPARRSPSLNVPQAASGPERSGVRPRGAVIEGDPVAVVAPTVTAVAGSVPRPPRTPVSPAVPAVPSVAVNAAPGGAAGVDVPGDAGSGETAAVAANSRIGGITPPVSRPRVAEPGGSKGPGTTPGDPGPDPDAETPPVEEPPAQEPPVHQPPVEEPPTQEPPASEVPAAERPADGSGAPASPGDAAGGSSVGAPEGPVGGD